MRSDMDPEFYKKGVFVKNGVLKAVLRVLFFYFSRQLKKINRKRGWFHFFGNPPLGSITDQVFGNNQYKIRVRYLQIVKI